MKTNINQASHHYSCLCGLQWTLTVDRVGPKDLSEPKRPRKCPNCGATNGIRKIGRWVILAGHVTVDEITKAVQDERENM